MVFGSRVALQIGQSLSPSRKAFGLKGGSLEGAPTKISRIVQELLEQRRHRQAAPRVLRMKAPPRLDAAPRLCAAVIVGGIESHAHRASQAAEGECARLVRVGGDVQEPSRIHKGLEAAQPAPPRRPGWPADALPGFRDAVSL
jgi:hypothetical protein